MKLKAKIVSAKELRDKFPGITKEGVKGMVSGTTYNFASGVNAQELPHGMSDLAESVKHDRPIALAYRMGNGSADDEFLLIRSVD